jgi:predicted adenine nucleotide alpha hydrolase (AANH) superfamily ATPase
VPCLVIVIVIKVINDEQEYVNRKSDTVKYSKELNISLYEKDFFMTYLIK